MCCKLNKYLSAGYELIAQFKNSIYQFVAHENTQKTKEVALCVFKGMAPHVVNMSSFYLAKRVDMRGETVFALMAFTITNRVLAKQLGQNWREIALTNVRTIVDVVRLIDLARCFPRIASYVPRTIEFRLAVDGMILLMMVIDSGRALYEGTHKIISPLNDENNASRVSKISDFVLGTMLVAFGAFGLSQSFQMGSQLIQGVKAFQSLDLDQKSHVLYYRAVQSLGDANKRCNAVVFYTKEDSIYDSFIEKVYINCETRAYFVRNSDQFCESLRDARENFGRPINIVSLNGHGDRKSIDIGYDFRGWEKEIDCLKSTISAIADIFLIGCNTARPDSLPKNFERLFITHSWNDVRDIYNFSPFPLAERMSYLLPVRRVTGIPIPYAPMLSVTSVSMMKDQEFSWFHSLTSNNLGYPIFSITHKTI